MERWKDDGRRRGRKKDNEMERESVERWRIVRTRCIKKKEGERRREGRRIK